MKPTEFLLTEGVNGFCPTCQCNTSTDGAGTCKLCGTAKQVSEMSPAEQTRLNALKMIGQKMLDVNNIFTSAKKKGDAQLMAAARQKLSTLAKEKEKVEARAQLNADVNEGVLPDWAADILNQEIAATKKAAPAKTIAPFKKGDDPRPVNNFEPEDIKALEQISDIATLKARCMALISATSQHQMKPEKVRWFARRLDSLHSRMAIIKLMYDLLLAGEGNQVIGTKWGMGKNSYRQAFGEESSDEVWFNGRLAGWKSGEQGDQVLLTPNPEEYHSDEKAPTSFPKSTVTIKSRASLTDESSDLDAEYHKTKPGRKEGMPYDYALMRHRPEVASLENTARWKDDDMSNDRVRAAWHRIRYGFNESDAGATSSASIATGPAGNLFAQPQKRSKKKVAEGSDAWQNYYDSEADLAQEILNFVQEKFGGKAWFKGGSYAYKLDATEPNLMIASDGSEVTVDNVAKGLDDYCDRGVFDDFVHSDPSYWPEFFRPVQNKIPMARDGAPAYGGEQERHELGNMRGESMSNILTGLMMVESQLNELKPKIIPRTLAGGKLNPNHPSNTQAIADQKAAKYKHQEWLRQERAARTARAKEKQRAQKATAKAKKSLGSPAPTTPLEKKAKDAMWQVWNAIAPDMMSAIRGGGYEDEEDLVDDPFYIAEVCCDANHMQTFAHLSPEEEREILDNLDRNTLARLASDFGV